MATNDDNEHFGVITWAIAYTQSILEAVTAMREESKAEGDDIRRRIDTLKAGIREEVRKEIRFEIDEAHAIIDELSTPQNAAHKRETIETRNTCKRRADNR